MWKYKALPEKHSTSLNLLTKEALQKAYQWFEEYFAVNHFDIIPRAGLVIANVAA